MLFQDINPFIYGPIGSLLLPTEFTPATYYSLTALNILLYVLIVLAYVQAIRTKSPLVKEVPFPRIRSQLRNNHPDYACHNRCEKEQDKYKPNRACHSSQDGCVVRFVSLGVVRITTALLRRPQSATATIKSICC